MADSPVTDSAERVEGNPRLLMSGLDLVGQAADANCPPARVLENLRQALAADGVGLAWVVPGVAPVWNFATACSDPGLAAELAALKSPLELAAIRQAIRTGQTVRCDGGDGRHEPAFFSDRIGVHHLFALPVRSGSALQGVAVLVSLKDTSFFDGQALRLFAMVCACLSLRLENIGLRPELGSGRSAGSNFSHAKDRVAQRFSHELKTPLAVLIACVKLLGRSPALGLDLHLQRVLERAQRNLQRLLDLEYQLEDILRERDLEQE